MQPLLTALLTTSLFLSPGSSFPIATTNLLNTRIARPRPVDRDPGSASSSILFSAEALEDMDLIATSIEAQINDRNALALNSHSPIPHDTRSLTLWPPSTAEAAAEADAFIQGQRRAPPAPNPTTAPLVTTNLLPSSISADVADLINANTDSKNDGPELELELNNRNAQT